MASSQTENQPLFHTQSLEQTLKSLQADEKRGLSATEVAARLEKYGHNELPKPEGESIWEKIKEQSEDLLVRILCLAAVISFLVSLTEDNHEEHAVPGWVEPLVIFTILILNAAVGIYQDYDAEKAIEALKELQSIDALVLRDGSWIHVPSRDVVPGDIVQIQQGDKIPADIRLIEIKTASIRIEQSVLTGESQAVLKTLDAVSNQKATISEKHNIVFSSTLVSSGNAIGVVIGTGASTEIGKINTDLQETENEDTPLKKRLEEFGETLAKAIGIICVIVWVINFRNFSDPAHGGFIKGCLYYFKVAVALAVAAIPEGLPAVITTCLALGTRRMAKERAIVRKLQSVETLGCTTVICSDKTGTLTTNEMVVKQFVLYGDNTTDFLTSDVSGISYQPEGDVTNIKQGDINRNASLRRLVECMSLNNDSKLIKNLNKYTRSGLPTEAALKVLVEKLKRYDDAILTGGNAEIYGEHISKDFDKVATLEFTRDRKSMSVVTRSKANGKTVMFIKGAPDYLIKNSSQVMLRNGTVAPLDQNAKKQLLEKVNHMAEKGLRTLALCYKEKCGVLEGYTGASHPAHKHLADPDRYAELETEPIIIGVVAIQDPPRPEVAEAIRRCRKAGISVIMITGDIKETAQAIGKEIGIINASEINGSSFTGVEFEHLSEDKQQEILNKCLSQNGGLIFSRTEPRHKKILVKELSSLNQIVAMTGDGVNDAPALKQAHIGIAMGINGTEVAKEASDMVLADDNFSTIVKAVEEGRAIFANMKAFIRYMISSNIGEVVSIFTSSVLGIPDGFNSIQLLWVNLVTDGFPATALSFNPPDPDIMSKPPRRHDEPIITPTVFVRYMLVGTYVGLATVLIFIYWYTGYDWSGDGHSLVTFSQLANWSECTNDSLVVTNFGKYTSFKENPCSYFTVGKQKASTLSLTVLVVIEMFNALNALSEDSSILTIGLFANPWLLVAIFMSMSLHCVILYIPFFAQIFGTAPLNQNDWLLVLMFSFPVCILEETIKFVNRQRNKAEEANRKKLE
jgi:Ca2+-transporting ATPase